MVGSVLTVEKFVPYSVRIDLEAAVMHYVIYDLRFVSAVIVIRDGMHGMRGGVFGIDESRRNIIVQFGVLDYIVVSEHDCRYAVICHSRQHHCRAVLHGFDTYVIEMNGIYGELLAGTVVL